MIDKTLLEQMSRMRLEDMDVRDLQDILEMEISGETAGQRLENYLSQGGNPYCFRVDGTPVRISFRRDGKQLSDRLKSYFLGLKTY